MTSYLYVHDWTLPCDLLASTQDRYNATTRECIQRDANVIHRVGNVGQVESENNYFCNAKWSPDGSCLLTNSCDNTLRLFSTPEHIYDDSKPPSGQSLTPSTGMREGGAVTDFTWFPSMTAQDPATCCYLTSVTDYPVQLWDANTGKLRASYLVVDHRERFIGPNVVTFNLDGTRIYCGYENMIEVFDVQQPGQTSDKWPTVPTRKSRNGIISCMDFCPDYSGLFAAGSYGCSIGIYDDSNHELCLYLDGLPGGVTQVKFSNNGHVLFATSRHSNTIDAWDIRNTAKVLYHLDRPGATNQRLSFDINASDVLVTGDTRGRLLFYNVSEAAADDDRLLQSMDAHQDVVSAAKFHPTYPAVASVSGQRKFSSRDENDEDDSDEDGDTEPHTMIDNTLRLWRIPGQWYQQETAAMDMLPESSEPVAMESLATTDQTLES